MGDFLVALGFDLHVADARAAPRAPGHDVVTAIQPAALVAGFDDAPYGVVVLLGHREIGIAPVHPLSESNALLADDARVLHHAVFTALHEFRDAVGFDVAFGAEAELFFDFNFDPESLAIEAVLPALIEAIHGFVALIDVLVRAAPCVMHTHRVIRGNRPIDKG